MAENTDKIITMTETELKDFAGKVIADSQEKMNQAAIDAVKLDIANKSLPDAMKSTHVSGGHAVAEKYALQIALYAMAKKGIDNTSIETTYKNIGVEKTGLLNEVMYQELEKKNSLSIGITEKSIMGASIAADGGFMISEAYSNQIRPMIEDNAVFRAAKPVIQPMPRGNFQMPYQTSGTSAYWVDEDPVYAATAPTFGLIKLDSKMLMAQTIIKNSLLEMADIINVGQYVMEQLSKSMGREQDRTFLMTGSGTAATPKSLFNYCLNANKKAITTAVSAANVAIDLDALVRREYVNMLNPIRGAFFMTHEVRHYISCQRTSTGMLYDYADEVRRSNTIHGMPIYTTTYMRDQGGATSTILLADMDSVIIGDVSGISIEFGRNAVYNDNGVMGGGISSDKSVYVAKLMTDLCVPEPKAISAITGVTWGISA